MGKKNKKNFALLSTHDRKSWTRRHCKYSIKSLREDIPRDLAQVKELTILRHYTSCFKKKELYRKKIEYKTSK